MTDYEILRWYDDDEDLPVDGADLPAVVKFLAEALDTHLVSVPGTDEYLLFVPSEDSGPDVPAPTTGITDGRGVIPDEAARTVTGSPFASTPEEELAEMTDRRRRPGGACEDGDSE